MHKSQKFSEISRAKVNLTLHVLGKRSDGYHYLDSLVAFPNIGDQITLELASRISLKIVGRLARKLSVKDNLILRAINLLNHNGTGVSIILNKDIPISAGLGGGSSNSAVVLKMLSKLWNQPLPSLKKQIFLGADVPVCMSWDLQRIQGIGEKIVKIKEPSAMWIVLVNLGDQVSTGLVFNSLESYNYDGLGELPVFNNKEVFIKFLLSKRNDLEIATIKLFPKIKNLLDAIKQNPGCSISRMSGSGGTCFGIFFKKTDAIKTSKDLIRDFPKAWIRVAKLFS